jgi:hypothetical protein
MHRRRAAFPWTQLSHLRRRGSLEFCVTALFSAKHLTELESVGGMRSYLVELPVGGEKGPSCAKSKYGNSAACNEKNSVLNYIILYFLKHVF